VSSPARLDAREGRRYLPHAGDPELTAFARRQLAARRRFTAHPSGVVARKGGRHSAALPSNDATRDFV
jgi:hypothetical protein